MTETVTSFPDRNLLWQSLKENQDQQWDVIVVGGGIIGAGVLREATRRGLKTLLIEQRDFAWGTSSRSSKMVHGGLRYIAQGDVKLTKHSVQERERLLQEAPGLINRMGYYFILRKGQFPGRFVMTALLTLYDWLAGIKNHRYFDKSAVQQHFPGIESRKLNGACYYTDTIVDDARMVLRVLQESISAGGDVVNYVKATKLLKKSTSSDEVTGLVVENVADAESLELKASVVINATGAWADRLRGQVVDEKRIRPLRGSHLVFSQDILPVKDTLAVFHPEDKRPVFVTPWEGATLVGTTDLDHSGNLDDEASITQGEVDYLLDMISAYYPDKNITDGDVISSYAGVRPVIGSDGAEKSKDPSKERRDHAVWAEKGLVTVSGGKLSTFRLIALDALNAAQPWLEKFTLKESSDAVFKTPATDDDRSRRLAGRYGSNARYLQEGAAASEQELIGNTEFSLAECRWAVKHEAVLHLDDLLLRRTRLGSLLENGAEELFVKLAGIFEQEAGWDRIKWDGEVLRYREIWRKHYSLPSGSIEKQ